MSQLRVRLIVAILLALLALPFGQTPVADADNPPAGLTAGLMMDVEVAFDGYFKYGEWLPVRVTLENSGSDLQAEIQVRVTGGMGAATFAAPALLPTGSRKRITVYVLPNNYSQELKVELVKGSQVLAARKVSVEPRPNNSYFVGIIAPERSALLLMQNMSLPGRERPKEFIDLSLDDLPEKLEGLRSFDCLILNNIDTLTLTPEQGESLEGWVQKGGRLIIGGGAGMQHTVAGLPDSLLRLSLHGEIEVDALPGLADFAGAEAIRVPGPFVMAAGEALAGHTLSAQNDLPLVHEYSFGDGYVDFVTLDLTISPFDAWTGTSSFWEKLLSPGAVYPEWLPPDMSARQMKSSQMAYALSNLPSLDLPSIRNLGILLILYVLLVGPANYFLLRRRKQLQWAWLTIPLITLFFSAGALFLGYALRGNDLILNKIAVIELHSNGSASVSSYIGLFSPARQSYEIEVEGDGLLAPLSAGYGPWGPGGSNMASELVFVQGEPARVRGLAVDQWSMQTFMTEVTWADLGRITSDLQIKGDELAGAVHNETAHTLVDAVLILGNHFTHLGNISPGQEALVTMNLLDLDARLGMPISYRLFEEQFESGVPSQAREIQLKQSMVDSIFQQSGRFGQFFGVAPLAGRELFAQTPVLLAWLDKAPPNVSVSGKEPAAQQTMALLHLPLDYRLADRGDIFVPPALIPGSLIEMPVEGGPCGPGAPSVYIGRGQAVFEFRVPEIVQDMEISALRLILQRDDGWDLPPEVAVYDWDTESWAKVSEPVMGVNVLTDVTLLRDDGLVRVSLSSDGGRGGCLYVELGLEGKR